QQAHLLFKAVDNGIDEAFFVGKQTLLGNFQAFILAAHVDKRGGQASQWIAQQGIERRANEGIEAPFQMPQGGRGIGQPVQERRASVGLGQRPTRIGSEVWNRSHPVWNFANYGRRASLCQWQEGSKTSATADCVSRPQESR